MNINLSTLPSHIIEVIFSKLSIFNLPACRTVSKNWNDLILNYVSSSSKIIPQTLFLHTKRDSKVHCIDFNLNYRGEIKYVASLGPQEFFDRAFIICSCSGLLLICTFINKFVHKLHRLDVLNPMTNEYFRLAEDENSYPDGFYYNGHYIKLYSYGFGISLKTKRYKVVRVPKFPFRVCNIEIITLGGSNNQWRCVERHAPYYSQDNNVYFNGALYWIAWNGGNHVICRFDLENEKIESRIYLPGQTNTSTCANLEAFNGSLYATFLYFHPCSKIQVWKMHNFGREDSWKIEFVVSDVPRDWMTTFGKTCFKFIKCYEDGEILCLVNGRFSILYNPKYGSIKILNQIFEEPLLYHSSSICRLDNFNFGSLHKIFAGDDG